MWIAIVIFITTCYLLHRKAKRRKPGKVVELEERVQSTVTPDEPAPDFNSWARHINN